MYFYAICGEAATTLIRKDNLFILPESFLRRGELIRICCGAFIAPAGTEGYYFLPRRKNSPGCALVSFLQREDMEDVITEPVISMFAVNNENGCWVVVPDRSYRYSLRVRVKENLYSVQLQIDPSSQPIDGDFTLRLLELPSHTDYNGVAEALRQHWFDTGFARPLAEKCRERPELEYARKYPLIRIRMGWKPAPAQVLHQTPKNEPPMHVACTFARVRDIADELKRQGVEGAELSLVGWNIRGHDGRWPQIFPVEEALGGEEELKKTIAHCQALGYRITCHTNSMDHYEIADTFRTKDLARDAHGKTFHGGIWAGGYCYRACPDTQLRYAKADLPRVAQLGFRGLHYIDVLSIIEPDVCFHRAHVSSFRQSVARSREIMALAQAQFGGFASEGCMDFTLSHLDFSLYNSFGDFFDAPTGICDSYVPVDLFLHGIVLSNAYTAIVNPSVKSPKAQVTMPLLGSRPAFYLYSKFVSTDNNWMGQEDLTCDGEEDLRAGVAAIKRACENYAFFADRQLHFIRSYTREETYAETVYDDGVRVVVNLTDEPVCYEGHTLAPYGFFLCKFFVNHFMELR